MLVAYFTYLALLNNHVVHTPQYYHLAQKFFKQTVEILNLQRSIAIMTISGNTWEEGDPLPPRSLFGDPVIIFDFEAKRASLNLQRLVVFSTVVSDHSDAAQGEMGSWRELFSILVLFPTPSLST